MITYVYDHSWYGFLTVVFEAYSSKLFPDKIVSAEEHSPLLIEKVFIVSTEKEHAQRVLKGMEAKSSAQLCNEIYKVFISDIPHFEMVVFNYIRVLFDSGPMMLENYSIPCILQMKQAIKRVNREVHRMHAYVRFQKSSDNIFYAFIAPDYNVLPLAAYHFEKRFADQRWMIYDTIRRYGIFYDLEGLCEVKLEQAAADLDSGIIKAEILDGREELYQQLWKAYFSSVNIPERKNIKLQMRSMPKRYWKHLTEMK